MTSLVGSLGSYASSWVYGSGTAEEESKTKAEVAEAKECLSKDIDESEEIDTNATFEVTEEEMKIIRAELACSFPEDYNYLSDSYVKSVASKPYSKDMTKRRPLDYTLEKLKNVMSWRETAGAPDLPSIVALANGPSDAAAVTEDPDRYSMAKRVATSLNYGAFYWHGFTKDGRPVLWIRTNRRPWYPDVEPDVKSLILLADAGISCMPPSVTDFCVISDSTTPPPPNPSFMINVMKALVKGYPDRLSLLVSAPVSSVIQFVMNLLLPLMPGRLSSKVCLMDTVKVVPKMEEILLNGADDIPTFFGGKADHDQFYPEEGSCPNRGDGCLKFDWYGMIERLEKARDEYIQDHPSASVTTVAEAPSVELSTEEN